MVKTVGMIDQHSLRAFCKLFVMEMLICLQIHLACRTTLRLAEHHYCVLDMGKHSIRLCVCISGYYISIAQSTFLFFPTHCTGMPHLIKINSHLDTHHGNKVFSNESGFFQGQLWWPNTLAFSTMRETFVYEMPTFPDLLLNIRSVLGSHILSFSNILLSVFMAASSP